VRSLPTSSLEMRLASVEDRGRGYANRGADRRAQSSRRLADRRRGTKPEINDQEPLEDLLKGQSPGGAAAIAARTALRVAPLMFRDARKARSAKEVSAFLVLTSATFRASALARVAVKYPTRANMLNAAALVAAARAAAAAAADAAAADAVGWAILTSASALAAAADAVDAAASALTAASAASALAAAADAAPSAIPLAAYDGASFPAVYATADGALRAEIRFDAYALQKLSAHGLADLPLWSRGAADWAEPAWEGLRLALPRDEGWDVWIDWYQDRLRGGSGGEAYELVFVSAPLDVWREGPAAANAWIKEHLPKDWGRARLLGTRKSLPGPA